MVWDMDPQEFDDPKVYDGLKDISNESMDFNDPKEFDDPKGILIGSIDFYNLRIYCDLAIFDSFFSHCCVSFLILLEVEFSKILSVDC